MPEPRFAARRRDELVEALRAAGVPAAPVQDAGEVWSHPQVEAMQVKQALPHPDAPEFVTYGVPFQFDGVRPPYRSAPPAWASTRARCWPRSATRRTSSPRWRRTA